MCAYPHTFTYVITNNKINLLKKHYWAVCVPGSKQNSLSLSLSPSLPLSLSLSVCVCVCVCVCVWTHKYVLVKGIGVPQIYSSIVLHLDFEARSPSLTLEFRSSLWLGWMANKTHSLGHVFPTPLALGLQMSKLAFIWALGAKIQALMKTASTVSYEPTSQHQSINSTTFSLFCLLLVYSVERTRNWTQDPMHAWHMLYHWAITTTISKWSWE